MASGRNLSLVGSLLLAACGGGGGSDGGGGGGGGGGGTPLEPTLASIQSNVFTPTCAVSGCHTGAGAQQGLRLESGMSHAMLVNVPSVEVPSLLRVEPGNPDDSYLIQKLEGTAAVGGRMPLVGGPLPQADIDVIRQWITDGALAAVASVSMTAAELRLLEPWPEPDIAPEDAPPVRELLVAADQPLDATLLDAGTVTLVASGGDGSFDDGNEQKIALAIVVTQHAPSVFRLVPAQPLAADRYRLRISGSAPLALADLAAVPIDGDRDGKAGGDFVAEFSGGPRR